MSSAKKQIKVTLARSIAGQLKNISASVRGLGLRRRHQSVSVADTPENRSKLCMGLKANLAALQGHSQVVMQQGNKTVALNADQRKQQIDTAQAQIQQYCQGN